MVLVFPELVVFHPNTGCTQYHKPGTRFVQSALMDGLINLNKSTLIAADRDMRWQKSATWTWYQVPQLVVVPNGVSPGERVELFAYSV